MRNAFYPEMRVASLKVRFLHLREADVLAALAEAAHVDRFLAQSFAASADVLKARRSLPCSRS